MHRSWRGPATSVSGRAPCPGGRAEPGDALRRHRRHRAARAVPRQPRQHPPRPQHRATLAGPAVDHLRPRAQGLGGAEVGAGPVDAPVLLGRGRGPRRRPPALRPVPSRRLHPWLDAWERPSANAPGSIPSTAASTTSGSTGGRSARHALRWRDAPRRAPSSSSTTARPWCSTTGSSRGRRRPTAATARLPPGRPRRRGRPHPTVDRRRPPPRLPPVLHPAAGQFGRGDPIRRRLPSGSTSADSRRPYSVSMGSVISPSTPAARHSATRASVSATNR